MQESRKRKIMGSRLYAIYRRSRYLHYLKRVRRKRRKVLAEDVNTEASSIRQNYARQKARQKKELKQQRKRQKQALRRERKAVKLAVREKRRQEKIQDQKKKKQEKLEAARLQGEARQAVKAMGREKKGLEKQRQQQFREEQKKLKKEVRARMKEKAMIDRQQVVEQKRKKAEEKRLRKQRLRKLRPYLIRRRSRETWRNLRSLNRDSLRQLVKWTLYIFENKAERNRFLKITLNSMSLFVLAYLTLYIAGELLTLYAAQTFEYKTILYYYKIYYNIDSDQWTPDAVKILYSIKPLAGLVLGAVAIVIFSSIRNDNQVFKLYFLWLFIHGMVMFFGSLLLGTLLNQGFGWVIAYLYYKDTGKMVFSIISIFALVITGAAVSRSFLISGNAYFNYIDRENRKFLLVSQVLMPALIGTFVIALMKIPNDLYFTTSEEVTYEIFKVSTTMIVIIPIILSFGSFSAVYFDEERRKIRFHWVYILVFLTIYFGYRFLLLNGMEFSMTR